MTKPIQFSQRGKGAAVEWLRAHVGYKAKSCLAWPFSRHPTGYGSLGVERKQHYAHRYMCELVHGPAPSDKHQAAHSCGNGHMGCVNPLHLSWKLIRDNLLDRRGHGTAIANQHGRFGGLTTEQVAQIRALKGVKTQQELADMFGVKRPAIQYWQQNLVAS
jgi:hypothetical protein